MLIIHCSKIWGKIFDEKVKITLKFYIKLNKS